MKTLLLVAAIAAGTSMAATAEAREGRGGARMELPSFEQLDANADGGITLEEIQAAMQAHAETRFSETDTNGDGALSAEEMIAKAQSDNDERIARRVENRIERADTNGDGLLQADEIAAQMEDRRGPSPDRLFNRVDQDDNGSISAEEYEEARAHMEERGNRGRRGDN